MASVSAIPATARPERSGLRFWMDRTLHKLADLRHASENEVEDAVHDLRVAIRRCRSLAAALQEVDPSKPWQDLRKQPRKLFRALGDWRDAQVLENWTETLLPSGDAARARLAEILAERASAARAQAMRAARKFDAVEWKQLERVVRRRAHMVPLDGPAAQCLALERLEEARRLQARALRSNRPAPWHRLRIGLKRFRYVVESLMPGRYAAWEDDFKRLQDLLGDVHDLDTLGDLLRSQAEGVPEDSAANFREILERERRSRILSYRQLTVGRSSLWNTWRDAFPADVALHPLVGARLRATARALDPQPRRTALTSQLGLRLFFALSRLPAAQILRDAEARRIFRACAQLLGVRPENSRKPAHKAARSLLTTLAAPPGWSPADWEMVGWVIRFHRGRQPGPKQRRYAALPEQSRQVVETLAGILRLARTLRRCGVESLKGLRAEMSGGTIVLHVPGWTSSADAESSLAKGKYSLERALRRPILLAAPEESEAASPAVQEAETLAVSA